MTLGGTSSAVKFIKGFDFLSVGGTLSFTSLTLDGNIAVGC